MASLLTEARSTQPCARWSDGWTSFSHLSHSEGKQTRSKALTVPVSEQALHTGAGLSLQGGDFCGRAELDLPWHRIIQTSSRSLSSSLQPSSKSVILLDPRPGIRILHANHRFSDTKKQFSERTLSRPGLGWAITGKPCHEVQRLGSHTRAATPPQFSSGFWAPKHFNFS